MKIKDITPDLSKTMGFRSQSGSKIRCNLPLSLVLCPMRCQVGYRLLLKRWQGNLFNRLPAILRRCPPQVAVIVFTIISVFLVTRSIYRVPPWPAKIVYPYERIDPYDVTLHNIYYYPTSESLGTNAVAMLFTAEFNWPEQEKFLIVRAYNSSSFVTRNVTLEQITINHQCMMLQVFATCETLPNMNRFQINLGEHFVDVPFREVSYEKKDVVTCIAPLFGGEQWQNLAFAAHIYKKYDTFLHVYVRSAVEPFYDLMRIYEREGYLTLEPWTRLTISTLSETIFNPNMNVAFRDQDTMQTDCLLRWKEAAEFITFRDLDDILIPRHGSTYYEEFKRLTPTPKHYIQYEKENTYVEASFDPENFNLDQMFRTIRMLHKQETGKMALRPAVFNHTTIHFPGGPQIAWIPIYTVPLEENVIIHLKEINPLGTSSEIRKLYPYEVGNNASLTPYNSTIFKEEDVISIEEDYQKMYKKHKSVFLKQPKELFYYPLISSCFMKRYYRFWNVKYEPEKITWCPTDELCRFPEKPGLMCANAAATTWVSTTNGTVLNLHYGLKKKFVIADGCIP